MLDPPAYAGGTDFHRPAWLTSCCDQLRNAPVSGDRIPQRSKRKHLLVRTCLGTGKGRRDQQPETRLSRQGTTELREAVTVQNSSFSLRITCTLKAEL